MIALDTNLLVRIATNDNPKQAEAAKRLLEGERVLLPVTVVLETEWVLRSRYAYTTELFVGFVRYLGALPNVELQHGDAVFAATKLHEQGCDFADALHVRLAAPAAVHTLDKALAKRLGRSQIKLVAVD